jgi:hypothetical protein
MEKINRDPVSSVYNEATRTWAFHVHADCWELVACRVSDPIACATTWCKALISLNWNLGLFPSGSKTSESPSLVMAATTPSKKNYRRLSLQRLDTFDGLSAELGLDHLPTVYEPVTLEGLGLFTLNRECLTRTSKGNDVFAALPDEILQQIIQCTPTTDLLNLRLASRRIAHTSRLATLPRGFWFSRFLPPFEMGFALAEQFDRNLDWRALYFLIRRAMRRDTIALPRADSCLARLAKRRHWWERLREIPELYSVWGAAGGTLEGILLSRPMSMPNTQHLRGRDEDVGCVAARLRGDDGAERCHSTVCLPLSARHGSISAVGVSVIELGGLRCISGLQFFYKGAKAPERLGYVLEQAETVVRLGPGESFLGFKVRCDVDAIRALKIIIRGLSGRLRITEWIGGVEAPSSSDAATQTAILVRRLGEAPCSLVASFDVSNT